MRVFENENTVLKKSVISQRIQMEIIYLIE